MLHILLYTDSCTENGREGMASGLLIALVVQKTEESCGAMRLAIEGRYRGYGGRFCSSEEILISIAGTLCSARNGYTSADSRFIVTGGPP
jgi:hypothetical protein